VRGMQRSLINHPPNRPAQVKLVPWLSPSNACEEATAVSSPRHSID
jgi:hypothetical protein